MSEPGFREIHLTTKQVVFLFIAGLAVLAAVYLLGVRTGRAVTADRVQDAQLNDPAADIKPGAVMPPATSPKPDELKYHDDLQGKAGSSAKSSTPPPALPDAPDPTPPKPTPTTTPAATTKTPAPTPTPAKPPAGGTFFVQVDSFGSRANAEREVKQIKAKGIAAFIFEASGPGAKFKVRVGPFADTAAAEVMRDRLRKEGFKPSVTR